MECVVDAVHTLTAFPPCHRSFVSTCKCTPVFCMFPDHWCLSPLFLLSVPMFCSISSLMFSCCFFTIACFLASCFPVPYCVFSLAFCWSSVSSTLSGLACWLLFVVSIFLAFQLSRFCSLLLFRLLFRFGCVHFIQLDFIHSGIPCGQFWLSLFFAFYPAARGILFSCCYSA